MPAAIVLIIILPACLLSAWFLLRPAVLLWQLHYATKVALGICPSAGRIAVSGVACGSPLHSPITETLCVYWEIEIWQYEGRSRTKIRDATSMEPILIDDGTGQLALAPAEIQLLRAQDGLRLFPDESPTPASQATLQRLGIEGPRAWDLFSSIVVYERCIVPNQAVYAFGWVGRGNHTGDGPAEHTRLTLVDCSEREFRRYLGDRIEFGIGVVLIWVVLDGCLFSGLLVKLVHWLVTGHL